MLGRLLKYELKDTARVIPFFYIIAVLFAAMVAASKKIGLDWFTVTSSILLIITGFAIVIVTFVVVVLRFYRNLFSNEGYLMFTLPVKPQQLLISKTIVAYMWLVISLLVFVGTFSVSMYGFGVDINIFTNMMAELRKFGLEKLIYFIIPMILLSVLYLLGQIYFSITFANKPAFQGIGAAAAFIVYFVTYIILKIAETLITIFAPLSLELSTVGKVNVSLSTNNMFGYLIDSIKGIQPSSFNIGIGGYIFDIIMIGVLFYLTGRMMNRKVSLR